MYTQKRKQTGTAMMEMVIVTPLMLLLIIGTGELGKAIIEHNTLNKSIRDGARHAAASALFGTTGTIFITPDIELQAKNLVVYGNIAGTGTPKLPNLDPSQITISDAGNNLLLLQAAYPYDPLVGPVLEMFGLGSGPSLGVTLTASVMMRAL